MIERLPHSNTYVLTPEGQWVAIFYTKIHDRLLRPLLAANSPPAPAELRDALRTIDRHVNDYTEALVVARGPARLVVRRSEASCASVPGSSRWRGRPAVVGTTGVDRFWKRHARA